MGLMLQKKIENSNTTRSPKDSKNMMMQSVTSLLTPSPNKTQNTFKSLTPSAIKTEGSMDDLDTSLITINDLSKSSTKNNFRIKPSSTTNKRSTIFTFTNL